MLYVFASNADGTASTYLGDFKVSKPGDNSLEAKANSRRRPADDKQLPQGTTTRVRTLIPSQFLARLGALDQQLLAAEATVESNKFELAQQGTLSVQNDKLIGRDWLKSMAIPNWPMRLPAVDVKGLLTAIVEEEEARNGALIEADRLMRALKKARDDFASIRQKNANRVLSLPQPAAADPTVAPAGNSPRTGRTHKIISSGIRCAQTPGISSVS